MTSKEIEYITDLPSMSKNKYTKVYNEFDKWNKLRGETPVTEKVVLKYFSELAERSKPSTLWTYYSMLKATLKLHDKIDISSFTKLGNYLKTQSTGYEPSKAKMFTEEQVKKFINEVPEDKWLDLKVICIFGICGAINLQKLVNVLIEHVRQYDDSFLVTLPKTQTTAQRTFTITGNDFNIVQKYIALRPPHSHNRFFIHYKNGKCTVQTIGKNTFSKMPQQIAKFLNLPNIDRYTSLSFSKISKSGPAVTSLSSINGQKYLVTNHVCTLRCGQVKCASEENTTDVFHAFKMLASSEYTVADVTPVLFTTKPTCRWIVAYKHKTEPTHYSNTDEKFEEITRSIPNNVKAIENYVRMNNVLSSAAYVVVYGVNCRCEKQTANVPLIQVNASIDDFESSMDAIKCEPDDSMDSFEATMDSIKCEPKD